MGAWVPREEIEEKVWGKGVFVDAEHGINTAMRKVRQALGDDPEAAELHTDGAEEGIPIHRGSEAGEGSNIAQRRSGERTG